MNRQTDEFLNPLIDVSVISESCSHSVISTRELRFDRLHLERPVVYRAETVRLRRVDRLELGEPEHPGRRRPVVVDVGERDGKRRLGVTLVMNVDHAQNVVHGRRGHGG